MRYFLHLNAFADVLLDLLLSDLGGLQASGSVFLDGRGNGPFFQAGSAGLTYKRTSLT